jgi:hypothetical protein
MKSKHPSGCKTKGFPRLLPDRAVELNSRKSKSTIPRYLRPHSEQGEKTKSIENAPTNNFHFLQLLKEYLLKQEGEMGCSIYPDASLPTRDGCLLA